MRARGAVLGAALLLGGGSSLVPAAAEPGDYDTSGQWLASQHTYGLVPDDAPSCGSSGTPLEVELPVSGLPVRRITDIWVRFTIYHPALGDVDATLVAPDGTEHVLFEDTGPQCDATADAPYLGGSYGFIDSADRDWWGEAAGLGAGETLESDPYRTSDATGAQTSMTAAFADVADPNGTWVLRVADDWNGGGRGEVRAALIGMSVDTTPPDTQVTGPESGATVADHPTYELTSTHDDVAGYQCQVNGSDPFACTSPWTPVLRNRDAPHIVAVAAVDRSGNVDPSPEIRTFTLQDRTAPETTVTSGPDDQAVLTAPPTWEFTSSAPDVSGFWCSLDLGAWTACTSPQSPTTPGSDALAPGPHSWAVVAVDVNGNTDPTPEVRRFVLRDVPCEEAQAALTKAERKLERALESGKRKRIRAAKRAVRAAQALVDDECADAVRGRAR